MISILPPFLWTARFIFHFTYVRQQINSELVVAQVGRKDFTPVILSATGAPGAGFFARWVEVEGSRECCPLPYGFREFSYMYFASPATC